MAAKAKSIDEIIKKLTLEEKASLCSGSDFWHTEPIPKKDIPSIMVSDGPHGLRKQILDGPIKLLLIGAKKTLLNVNL